MAKYYLICDYREKYKKSTEKDCYSYKSIQQILCSLTRLGYDCVYFGGTKELIESIHTNNYDKEGIYLNFNDGIDAVSKRGQTPMLLDIMGVKYSGSSALTHLAVSDKFFTNKYLENKILDLIIPPNVLVKNQKDLTYDLRYPVILKPNNEGSSLGIYEDSLCKTTSEVIQQYNKIKHFGDVIIQEFVNGYELTNYFIRNKSNIILFNELLLLSKGNSINMDNKLFTFEDKIEHKRKYFNPANYLKANEIKKIKSITEKIAHNLEIVTLGRVDYRFFNNHLYFIEANTVPAFSKTSDIGEICKIYNLSYDNILILLINSLNQ